MCRNSIHMIRRNNTAQAIPAFLAVLLLLLANTSHIHLRYCLDGDEAPVSIHFETDDSHPEGLLLADNLDKSDLADVESELSLDTLLAKIFKASAESVAVPVFYLPPITKASQRTYLFFGHDLLPDNPETLLPPTRAPPAIA